MHGQAPAAQMSETLTAAVMHTGLYRGYSVTLMRDVPSYGLYFVAYHVMTRWAQSLKNPPPAASIPLLAGAQQADCRSHECKLGVS